jgi:hypothetical protein
MNDGDECPTCDEGKLLATGQQKGYEWFKCRNKYCGAEFSESITMSNKVIIATHHENGDIRLWSMEPVFKFSFLVDSKNEFIIKEKLKEYIDNKIEQNSSPVKDFVVVTDDGYPHIANKD